MTPGDTGRWPGRALPRIEPCPTSSFPVTSCPPTDASAAARRRSAPRSSRRSPAGSVLLGTSHRQAPVKDLVGQVRSQLGELFRAPDRLRGHRRQRRIDGILGCRRIRPHREAQPEPRFGEFGGKFAAAAKAPWLRLPTCARSPRAPARRPSRSRAWTSTPGRTTRPPPVSSAPVTRVRGDDGALTVIDATSAAGGIDFSVAEADVYYFAPQKNLGSDGGLWFAVVSPAAIERIERIAASDRYIPEFLSLKNALDNSRLNQTLNTPALSTLILLDEQLRVDHRQRRPAVGRRPHPGVVAGAVRLGRGIRLRDAVRRRPRRPLAGRRDDRLRRSVDAAAVARACAPTASSTPSPIASSAATSCGSRRSSRSIPTTCVSSSAASTTRSRTLSRATARQRRREDHHGDRTQRVRGRGSRVRARPSRRRARWNVVRTCSARR